MSGFLNNSSSGGTGGPPTGPAGGDLSGNFPNPTVVSVADVTTGVLPAANQAAQTMGGDVTGTTAASVVTKIQGVTISGTPQDGYVLEATSSTAASWQSPTSASLLFSNFYGLQGTDNAATIAQNAPVFFPRNGPSNGAATSLGAGYFNLPAIGTYEVSWQVSIDEAGQLMLAIGGVGLADTVVGRATGNSQIVGNTMITTTVINSQLSVINPVGNPIALTVTTNAGGATAVSCTLSIKLLSS
jgi:hypothetical protein